MPKPSTVGLKQRIQAASSTAELEALLTEGEKYTDASPGTRRSWQREASKRTLALASPARK